jgi:hypothetical protein
VFIANEIEASSKKWHNFKLELQSTYDEATRKYRELSPLIKYIEEAMMNPDAIFAKQVEWITVRYGQLEKVYNEGTKVYNDKVKPFMAAAKLLELNALNSEFDRLTAFLK